MTRHLAHIVSCDGKDYPMHIAEISDDRKECRLMPYAGETHSTRFHNGRIVVRKDSAGLYEVVVSR